MLSCIYYGHFLTKCHLSRFTYLANFDLAFLFKHYKIESLSLRISVVFLRYNI